MKDAKIAIVEAKKLYDNGEFEKAEKFLGRKYVFQLETSKIKSIVQTENENIALSFCKKNILQVLPKENSFLVKIKNQNFSIQGKLFIFEDEIFFLVGGDSFRDFPDWKCYRKLLTLCTFLVVPRPGISGTAYLEKFHGDEAPPRVHFVKNFSCDISSTKIRKNLSEEIPVFDDLPPQVLDYIARNRLYIN